MPAIAVVGANGQVGTEVCLCLAQMKEVRLIPIVRTKLSAAFLEQCGLECQVGSMQDVEEAKRLLRTARSRSRLLAPARLARGDSAAG